MSENLPPLWRANKRHLRNKYRMTPEQFGELSARQGGRCAICDEPTPVNAIKPHLVVDHDHSCCSGAGATCGICVRGLLCMRCNTGLGFFKDDPELLEAAIRYLATGKKRITTKRWRAAKAVT